MRVIAPFKMVRVYRIMCTRFYVENCCVFRDTARWNVPKGAAKISYTYNVTYSKDLHKIILSSSEIVTQPLQRSIGRGFLFSPHRRCVCVCIQNIDTHNYIVYTSNGIFDSRPLDVRVYRRLFSASGRNLLPRVQHGRDFPKNRIL